MKKIFLALMAVAAIVLTGCMNHKTATVRVVNESSKDAIVYFSENKSCSSPEEATLWANCPAGKAVGQKDVKLNGLFAIIYLEEGTSAATGETAFKRIDDINLNEYVGMAEVTITITKDGMYNVNAVGL